MILQYQVHIKVKSGDVHLGALKMRADYATGRFKEGKLPVCWRTCFIEQNLFSPNQNSELPNIGQAYEHQNVKYFLCFRI